MDDKVWLCTNFMCKHKDYPHVHEGWSIDSPARSAPWPLRTKWSEPTVNPRGLITFGWFASSSGFQLPWKIDCDCLGNKEIEAISHLIRGKFAFGNVIGIPRGGFKLAEALSPYCE